MLVSTRIRRRILASVVFGTLVWTWSAGARAEESGFCFKSRKFVEQFLRMDFLGARLQSNPKVDAMIEGPEQPAWAAAAVVNGYKIQSCSATKRSAVVSVFYYVIGTVSSSSLLDHPDFSTSSRSDTHRFRVTMKRGRMRLTDVSDFKPHISMNTAIHDLLELARQNPTDPAVTKGADRAIAHLKATAERPVISDEVESRQPASTFEP